MMPGPSFLDDLEHATERATQAENHFRRDVARQIKALENERAFSFRRYNLMRAVADAVASSESEEIAVAAATAVLRAKLSWLSDSEARAAVLSRFVPVAQAMFASLAPADDEDTAGLEVIAALAEFERWYAESHPGPFWILFENYMPETPVVDF